MSQDQEGCQYREHQDEAPCRKLCNPGHTHCPYHELLLSFESAARGERQERGQRRKNGRAANRRLREEKIR